MTASPRRWLKLALAPLVATALLVAPAAPATAAPGGNSTTPAGEDGEELLSDAIESSNRRFVAARAAVRRSALAQQKLAAELKAAETRRDQLIPEVNAIAAQQYMTGNSGTLGYLLGAADSNDFMHKAVSLEEINRLHDRKLRELTAALETVSDRKARIDAELKSQQANAAQMRKLKEAADDELRLLGGSVITAGFVDAESKVAAPAPRNSEGGFSAERCTEDDLSPANGCVTKRTLHMYKEVKKAGFNRFVNCYRSGGPFEHPKGRACDWALQNKGFSRAGNDDQKRYGNDLMAFLVRNADRLGIYYVIWWDQIWFPATGWHSYSGPSDHKDHVHVSML